MVVIAAPELGQVLCIEDATDRARARRHVELLHKVCTALIENYAPGAPDSVKSEALCRVAGYLHGYDGSAAALQQIQITGSSGAAVDLKFRSACGSALRCSGASALLSPWRVRRAVRVAESA